MILFLLVFAVLLLAIICHRQQKRINLVTERELSLYDIVKGLEFDLNEIKNQ